MSITPKGISIQSIYKDYRENKLVVNRKYQRKLVWTLEEKERLIDTILRGYPIPLFLLAERKDESTNIYYEIIDGLQRLNAIFTFIENFYPYNNKYFDVEQLARVKQLAEEGIIDVNEEKNKKLDDQECADFLDYQLAITVFPVLSENEITDVFNRINSSGKQLSNQERRQAGVVSEFGEIVRKLASEIRGDVSSEIVELQNMPAISIDSSKYKLGYGLSAEDTLWCNQGILWSRNLRDSEDEEIIADILSSILLDEPFNRSRERLDELYSNTELSKTINMRLNSYGTEKILNEVKEIFSIFNNMFFNEAEKYFFRNIIMGKNRNPAKAGFYTVFMALYELIVSEGKSPVDNKGIIESLKSLQTKLTTTGHYITSDDRRKNIDLTKGLISNYFAKKEPPILGHGPSLTLDLTNSLRRSKVETAKYEFKQGILKLNDEKSLNSHIYQKIVNTICAIANLGKYSEGYIFLGIADKQSDNERIKLLYKTPTYEINEKFVVGIDHECRQLDINVEKYLSRLFGKISSSQLSEPTKTQVLSQIDTIEFKGLSIIRIKIPSQLQPTYVGNKIFIREDSSTKELTNPRKIAAIVSLFS